MKSDQRRLSLQIKTFWVLIAFISVAKCYKEDPHEYEKESVSHIDYEQDQMPIKMKNVEGTSKVKRMASRRESPFEYEIESVRHIKEETEQTPAEDRNWQVKPKVKRMSQKSGKKIHIYLKNEEPKTSKTKKPSTTTTTSGTEQSQKEEETQTRKTPELTTKSDNIRHIKYADKDTIASGSSHSVQKNSPSDAQTDGSDHFDHVIKEKIKIKHHHHHHHHNHVKTVVKKEPYPVEKIVHVPFEKIVEKVIEKKVPYKVEVPVEKIVEKVKNTS